jgi:hypothetical protein
MVVRTMAVVALAVTLSACETIPTRYGLDPVAGKKLQDVRVINIVVQDEIVMRAEKLDAGPVIGGLVGSLVASAVAESRQRTIQDRIAPFYASVDNYDFGLRLNDAFARVLGTGSPVKFGPVERSPMMSAYERSMTGQNGLMEITTTYTFTGDLRTLFVTTRARMIVPGTFDGMAYANTFFYASSPVGNGGADSLEAWSANQGKRYREAADDAALQIAAMLKLDLASGKADAAGLPTIPMPVITGVMSGAYRQVPVLQSHAGRSIVRHAEGHLYSIIQ